MHQQLTLKTMLQISRDQKNNNKYLKLNLTKLAQKGEVAAKIVTFLAALAGLYSFCTTVF